MKKRVISGVFAVLLAVSAVTGISAASDMELSGELQETFQDETEEKEIPIEEQEPEFSEGDSSEFEESPETDFEQDSAEDYFEVITSADQGVIVFEADLLNLEKSSKTDLSEEELQQLQEQEHTFQAGEIVGFYIQPFDGYECREVMAESEGENISVTLGENQKYEFFMPQGQVLLRAEFEKDHEETAEEADIFTDGKETEDVAAAARTVAVKAVAENYKMRAEYAFAYAFRKGVTKLTEVRGASANLPSKLDAQFGWSQKGMTNYKNTFSACSIQNADQKGKISVKYTNVGEYKGKIVDLRITVPEWGAVSYSHIGVDDTVISPCILFYNDRIAFSTVSAGSVRFKFEFFDHATGNQIYPKGHVTMMDLDGGQGFRVYDGWGVDAMYIRSGYKHLQATTGTTSNGGAYTEVRAPEGVATEIDDVKGWCHVDFNKSFTLNWLAGEAGLNGVNPYTAFFMSGAQTVGTYEPNEKPEKKVGNTNAAYSDMTRHESESDTAEEKPYHIPKNREFDYVIAQTVLPGDYKKFELTDKLDSCLEYRSASVKTALGNDVTQRFTVSNAQNTVKFTAADSFLKSDAMCNNVTYYFRIHVKVKADRVVAGHGHYKDGMYYHISNQAERRLESSRMTDVQKTNVSWVRGSIERNCSIQKTDAADANIILSDAVFEVYEWNEQKKNYTSAGQRLSYSEKTKTYSKKLQYTGQNKGKFRLVETQAPAGYIGGWKKDISILDMEQDFTLKAENTLARLPYGEITVTKKILEKDIIWAHGNPFFRFIITGKDQRGMEHSYENYVEFEKGNYNKQDDYAILNCTISRIPLGRYTISEKETLRYRFQDVTADTSNVQITGKDGIAVLDRENKTAKLTFTNIKTHYDGYSHTDIVRNIIPVKKTE